jgi:hypothetical protein
VFFDLLQANYFIPFHTSFTDSPGYKLNLVQYSILINLPSPHKSFSSSRLSHFSKCDSILKVVQEKKNVSLVSGDKILPLSNVKTKSGN